MKLRVPVTPVREWTCANKASSGLPTAGPTSRACILPQPPDAFVHGPALTARVDDERAQDPSVQAIEPPRLLTLPLKARVAALCTHIVPTTAIVVQTLRGDWLVEIEIIAAAD